MNDGSVTHADLTRIEEILRRIEAVMDERDRRYEERYQAGEKALIKLEATNKENRAAANEWREANKDLIHNMPTVKDVENLDEKIEGLRTDILSLRESRAKGGGRDEVIAQARETKKWLVGLSVTVVLFLIAQGVFFLARRG